MNIYKIINKQLLGLKCFILFFLALYSSCENDDVSDESIFIEQDDKYLTDFDNWLYDNYVQPYNIRLYYRFVDIESNYVYNLAPAKYENSIQLAHIVKYAWLEAYDEVAGMTFTKKYVPKIIHFVGSAAYNSNGTMVLGTAEDGMKVTLYLVNQLEIDKDFLNKYYFKTMHHEFSHILHQIKNYDKRFERISESDYISGDWYLRSEKDAHSLGFVSPYAMSEAREDIAEITSVYIISSEQEWDAIIQDAGINGAFIINEKLNIVKEYMLDSWNIDLDNLRYIVQRRMNDIVNGDIDLNNLN